MVAPDGHILDFSDWDLGPLSDLAKRSVVVQACEAGDVLVGDLGCVLLQDEGIGVCWVGHHEYLSSIYLV